MGKQYPGYQEVIRDSIKVVVRERIVDVSVPVLMPSACNTDVALTCHCHSSGSGRSASSCNLLGGATAGRLLSSTSVNLKVTFTNANAILNSPSCRAAVFIKCGTRIHEGKSRAGETTHPLGYK